MQSMTFVSTCTTVVNIVILMDLSQGVTLYTENSESVHTLLMASLL